MRFCFWVVVALLLVSPMTVEAQSKRDQAVRADKQEFSENDSWIYDDLEKAMSVARESNRPLMVVFR